MRSRLAAYAVSVSVAAGAVLSGGTAAQAAISVVFDYGRMNLGWVIGVETSDGQNYIGEAEWFQDPSDYYPGDTLSATDFSSDGYGIEAHLTTSPQRIATTRGHAAQYTDMVSGNLPEDTKYYMYVCVVKGTYSNCSNSIAVYS